VLQKCAYRYRYKQKKVESWSKKMRTEGYRVARLRAGVQRRQ
jgi:hypothetical protein